jgi:hypothetical protein
VNALVAPAGIIVEDGRQAEARETGEAEGDMGETWEEDETKTTAAGESLGRVEAMLRQRVLRCPNEVERERGGNFRTREGVQSGMFRMNPRDKARINVEREGDPKVRCQYATKRGRGRAWSVKSADGGEMGSEEVGGIVMFQRSEPAVLEPVRKGVTAEGESKKATEVLVKMACP